MTVQSFRSTLIYMKSRQAIAILSLLIIPVLFSFAQRRKPPKSWSSALTAGTRSHADHPTFTEMPFADGDTSYYFAYELHENAAFWQFGVGYATSVGSTNITGQIDRALTPQLHIIMTDKKLWGGIGIMKTYLYGDESTSTDLYWQLQLGLAVPMGNSLRMQVAAYYIMEDFGDIGDFDKDELEWGFTLSYLF